MIHGARLNSFVQKARLTMVRDAEPLEGWYNGKWRRGYMVHFMARTLTDLGRWYACEKSLFVAPQDPNAEYRSHSSR